MSIVDATMLDCQDMASTARGMMVASCTRNNYQDMASLISRLQCFVDREAAFGVDQGCGRARILDLDTFRFDCAALQQFVDV